MDENVGSAEEGREGRGEEEENLARSPLLSPPAVEENLFPNSRFLIFVRANFFGFSISSSSSTSLSVLTLETVLFFSFPQLSSAQEAVVVLLREPFRGEKKQQHQKGEFLFFTSSSFLPLSSTTPPPPPPSFSEKTIQNLWSVFCIPCCHWHADESMGVTNPVGLSDPKERIFFSLFFFSSSFLFFPTSTTFAPSFFFLFFFLLSSIIARASKQKKGIKTKNQKPGAMMIKRQITQRTRVSDSVRPHRRR